MADKPKPAPLPDLRTVLEQRASIFDERIPAVPDIAPAPRIGIPDAAPSPDTETPVDGPAARFTENLALVSGTTSKLHRIAAAQDTMDNSGPTLSLAIIATLLIPVIGVLLTLLGYWLFNAGMAIDLSGGE